MASSIHLDHRATSSEENVNLHQSLKLTTIDLVGGIECHICQLIFANKKDFDGHYTTHNNGSSDIVYSCVVCHKKIVGYPSFRGHCYSIHVMKDKYKCKHCSKSLSKKTALQEHIDAMHNFKCNFKSCKKQFPSKTELRLHKMIHNGNKPPYPCQTCKKPIDSLDMCEHHIDQHCQLNYSCPICNESITRANATEHITKHFGDILNDDAKTDVEVSETSEDSSVNIAGGIFCCFCNEIYKNRSDFDSHFIADHIDNDIVYSCNICKKKFERYGQFGDHCYNHFSKDRFECDSCDKSFSRLSLLVLHTDMSHSAGAKPLHCVICEQDFRKACLYRDHLRVAHDINQISCSEPGCTMTFETPKDLVMHQKDHRALDNWCRQCGLQFTTLASCEKHLEVHKKKLYFCPVCNRHYGEKYLLINHISQHFETVFHMCKTCGKVYNAKHRLVEHVKTHSNVKNYKCKFCGKGFAKSNHLEQHLHMHTGARPYECIKCPKAFATYPNFHKHMRKVHHIDTKIMKKSTIDNIIKNGDIDVLKSKLIEKSPESDVKSDVSMSSKPDQEFDDSDESTMDSDSIDPNVIEKESMIFESDLNSLSTNSDTTVETTNLLPENNTTLESELSPLEPILPIAPREYGPDFVNTGVDVDYADYSGKLIDLDDHILPHIDPHLTIKATNNLYVQNLQYEYDQTTSDSKWEPPVLTRIYGSWEIDEMTANRLSIINTDIY